MKNLDQFKAFAKQGKQNKRKNSNKAVIYTRVSTKEQAENNHSLETQKKHCDKYALDHGLQVVAYFGGTYESAKTDERKEFKKMLSFVKNSKEQISTIIIYSPDRFSRSGANAIYISKELQENHISIKSVLQETDTSTPGGKMMQNMQFLMSEMDNMQRKEKCIAGTKEKLLRGEWPVKAPMGYDQVTIRGEQRITVNATGKLIRKAFLMKAEQKLSNTEIKERLAAMGLKLYMQNLTKIFANPFYCGIITHALLDGKPVEGKQEKLISPEVFLKVNGINSKNVQGYTQQKYDPELPLRNYVKCGSCGTPMTGYIVKKKSIHYYKCNKIGCKVNKSAKQLHAMYEQLLATFAVAPELLAPIKDQMLATFVKMNKEKLEEVKLIKANLKEIEQKLDMLEERFVLKEEITKQQFEKFNQKLQEEKRMLLASFKGEEIKLSNLEKYIDFSLQMCSQMDAMWVSGDYHQRQKLQTLVFPEGIEYDKENKTYRTRRTNSVFKLINCFSEGLMKNKNGINQPITDLSRLVGAGGIEPIYEGMLL